MAESMPQKTCHRKVSGKVLLKDPFGSSCRVLGRITKHLKDPALAYAGRNWQRRQKMNGLVGIFKSESCVQVCFVCGDLSYSD